MTLATRTLLVVGLAKQVRPLVEAASGVPGLTIVGASSPEEFVRSCDDLVLILSWPEALKNSVHLFAVVQAALADVTCQRRWRYMGRLKDLYGYKMVEQLPDGPPELMSIWDKVPLPSNDERPLRPPERSQLFRVRHLSTAEQTGVAQDYEYEVSSLDASGMPVLAGYVTVLKESIVLGDVQVPVAVIDAAARLPAGTMDVVTADGKLLPTR